MKADNYRLISEVAKRRSLWDTTMPRIDRKEDMTMLWCSVADIMQQDVVTVKKRFKGLRDSYRAEVRKIQKQRIGMSQWPYFRALEFMRHIFDPQQLVPFPPEPVDGETDFSDECNDLGRPIDDFVIDVDVDNDDSVDFEIMDDIFKRESSEHRDSYSERDSVTKPLHSSPKAIRSDLEISPRLLSPLHLPQKRHHSHGHHPHYYQQLPRPTPPAKRSRRRKTSSSYEGPVAENGPSNRVVPAPPAPPVVPANAPTETANKEDADYSFLVSLLPHMKSLSNLSNLRFRMEISRILVDLKKEETPAPKEPPPVVSGGLPRLTPAPDSSFAILQDKSLRDSSLSSSGYLHATAGSLCNSNSHSEAFVDSSMIECDVKIEEDQRI